MLFTALTKGHMLGIFKEKRLIKFMDLGLERTNGQMQGCSLSDTPEIYLDAGPGAPPSLEDRWPGLFPQKSDTSALSILLGSLHKPLSSHGRKDLCKVEIHNPYHNLEQW